MGDIRSCNGVGGRRGCIYSKRLIKGLGVDLRLVMVVGKIVSVTGNVFTCGN